MATSRAAGLGCVMVQGSSEAYLTGKRKAGDLHNLPLANRKSFLYTRSNVVMRKRAWRDSGQDGLETPESFLCLCI